VASSNVGTFWNKTNDLDDNIALLDMLTRWLPQ
jgi:hypothetical protein